MIEASQPKIRIEDLSFFFGDFQALDRVTLDIQPHEVFGLMGPSKSGKSTLLRVLNRMCDLLAGVRVTGGAWLDGEDILAPDCDVVGLRRRVGLVLSRPTPLPRSIYENLVLAPRLAGKKGRARWTKWWRPASRRRSSGAKSRTGSGIRRSNSLAASSSACVWPAPWPWSPK